MKRMILTVAAVASLAVAAAPAAQAASLPVKFCGGSGYARVWAGQHTSCGMATATHRSVASIAGSSGETPSSVAVTSPVTGRTYRMRHASTDYHVGSMPVAKWVGRGDHGSQITVFFWIP